MMSVGQNVDDQTQLDIKKNSVTELLVSSAACIFLVWYLRFLWRRRGLYRSASRLPGPLALPLLGSALSFIGTNHENFERAFHLFNCYPKLFKVWFGLRLYYCVTEPKYMEILLSSPHVLRKDLSYSLVEPTMGHGLFTAPVVKWKKNRKIITPTFSKKNLDQFMEVFVEQSEILTEVMKKHAGKGEIDLLAIISRCTLDFVCETAMGVQIQAQRTNSEVPHWIDRILEIILTRGYNFIYFFDLIFNNSPLGKEFHNLNNKLLSFTKKIIRDKKIKYKRQLESKEDLFFEDETSKRKAFLDLLIEMHYETDGNHDFTDEDLLNETVTFIIAASDTTATTICFTLTMLGMHQDIQDKVLAEILDVVGPDRAIELSDLPKLKYLEQVIKESLRLFPVAAFIGRAVDQDTDIGDHVLQKGTGIFFGIISIHRNENYWPDPYKFEPDRFLPENITKRVPGCYLPFSLGPRNCIGLKYGMMALKTLLATVLRKYRIYTAYKDVKDVKVQQNLVLRSVYGYKVSLELRT